MAENNGFGISSSENSASIINDNDITTNIGDGIVSGNITVANNVVSENGGVGLVDKVILLLREITTSQAMWVEEL